MQLHEYEEKYRTITALYDAAAKLVEATGDARIRESEQAQCMDIVEPLAVEVQDIAGELEDEFILLCGERKQASQPARKMKVEASLRRMFLALADFGERVKQLGEDTARRFHEVTEPIIEDLRRVAENIVASFVALADLSLERFMHKRDIDAFRQHHVAHILHEQSVTH